MFEKYNVKKFTSKMMMVLASRGVEPDRSIQEPHSPQLKNHR